MSEKEIKNSKAETGSNKNMNWIKKNGKTITSIILFVIVNLLFAWFYNAYVYERIFSYNKWWINVFYVEFFTFSDKYSIYFNLLFLLGVTFLLFMTRCYFFCYSKKFLKSAKYFGALLQHYAISFLLILILSPIFNVPHYQSAFLFNGDFVIATLVICFIFFLFEFSKKSKCNNKQGNILTPNDGDPINSIDDDLLKFDNIIATISADIVTIGNKSSANIYGLSGDWGSGKTSLFNLLESHFDNEKKKENVLPGYGRIRVIKINVHKYENPKILYLYLFDELLLKLQEEILIPRLDSFVITKTILFPFIKGINLDSLLNKVMPLARVDSYLKKYSLWLQKMDLAIVCLIDDVDRLQKKKDVDSVFKLINLVKQNMSNIVLFVNFDSKILSKFYETSRKAVKS